MVQAKTKETERLLPPMDNTSAIPLYTNDKYIVVKTQEQSSYCLRATRHVLHDVTKIPALQVEIQCFLYQGYANDGQDFIDIQDYLPYNSRMNKQGLKERVKNEPSERKEWMDERRKAPRFKEE